MRVLNQGERHRVRFMLNGEPVDAPHEPVRAPGADLSIRDAEGAARSRQTRIE